MTALHLLGADLGGTKTLLQLVRLNPDDPDQLLPVHAAEYRSADHADLRALIGHFLQDAPVQPQAACFAVAGPVDDATPDRQLSRLTNLGWQLDSERLQRQLGMPVRLVNDFLAMAHGIDHLRPDELVTLHASTETPAAADAPRVVMGAGTGLGVALVMPCGNGQLRIFPTEAGHIDFAGSCALDDALLAFLRTEFGHVSWERAVSGPGLINIYRFLKARDAGAAAQAIASGEPDALLQAPDPAAAIATATNHPRATAAMRAFVRLYGAFAGNLALACLPSAGIYLAGGIAAKILPQLQQGDFVAAYLDKGRMRPLVSTMPVRVVTNPHTGLLGALQIARQLVSHSVPQS